MGALDREITEDLAGQFIELERPFRGAYPHLRSTLVHRGSAAPLSLRERLDRRGIAAAGNADIAAATAWASSPAAFTSQRVSSV